MKKRIKLAITDDDSLYRSILISFLKTFRDIEILTEASDGKELIDSLKSNKIPDIILLDLEMPGMNGFETTEYLFTNYPEIKILLLTMSNNDELFNFLIAKGVNGFLLKNLGLQSVIDAIYSVNNTGYYFSNIDLKKIIATTTVRNINQFTSHNVNLSEREIEIVRLICQQYTNKEISGKLCISTRTVDGHRNKLLQKMNVKNTAGIVIFALRNNLIGLNFLSV